MNKQGLIFFPLAIMFLISMFALLGLGGADQNLGNGYQYGSYPEVYLYDYTGRPMIYTANMTRCTPESLLLQVISHDFGDGSKSYAGVSNTTGLFVTAYYLYTTSVGNSTGLTPVLYDDFTEARQRATQSGIMDITADFNSSYGLIALFIALLVGIGLAGIHFLGIGEAETSLQTIFMGIGFLAVWAVFSLISLNLIVQIEIVGPLMYFGLTFLYVVGLILNIGGGN